MSVFSFLPVVEKGCFCLSLKIASILIAIFGITGVGWSGFYLATHTACGPDSTLATIIKYARPILVTGDVILCVGAIIFLIGIIIQRRITGELFLLAIAIVIISYLFYAIAALVVSIIDSKCQDYAYPITLIIRILVWVYFMIIIRSFKDEME